MKKEILALKCPGYTGKTTSIRILFERFLKHNPKPNIIIANYWAVDGPKIDQETFKSEEKKRYWDIYVILEIENKKIGIVSQGDPNTSLKDKLEELIKKGCDIIITACRTSGGTVNAIAGCTKKGYSITFFDYISETNNNKNSNNGRAELLYNKIFS